MTKDLTTATIGEYVQHPVAIKLMPGGMDEPEFTAFCEDVEERGIIMPVTIYEGMILDGWHRYRAGHKTGTPFKTIEYTGKDPAGYITAVNVLRRKLSSLHRALVGVRLHLDHNLTQRQVCRKLGISNEVVNLVLKAVNSGNAVIIKRIETDSDYSRGMLREDLADVGLTTPKVKDTPLGPNSVFSQAGAASGIEHLLEGKGSPDTDGSDDDEEEPIPDTGRGKAKADRAARKPSATAAQLLADGFKALMADEKTTFLQMIWPEAKLLAIEAKLYVPRVPPARDSPEVARAKAAGEDPKKFFESRKKPTTPIAALAAAVNDTIAAKKAASKKAVKQ